MAREEQKKSPPRDEIAQKNGKAAMIGIVAGILLLVAGVTGVAAWNSIQEWVNTAFADVGIKDMLAMVFTILILLAALGGIMVIIGAMMFKKEKVGSGKFFVFLGVGVGLLGFIFGLIAAIGSMSLLSLTNVGLGFVGIVMSLVSRKMATKRDKPKK